MTTLPVPTLLLTDPDCAEYQALLTESRGDLVIRTSNDPLAMKAECEVWLGSPDSVIPLIKEGLQPRWIQLTWAGVTPLVGVSVPEGCQITRALGVFGAPMLEYVLHHMLTHAWSPAGYPQAQNRFNWRPSTSDRLSGKRVLIVGMGSIGRHIGAGLSALGMRIFGIQRTPSATAGVEQVGCMGELLDYAASADVVVNVLPDTPDTHDLYDANFFSTLPGNALFINIGRGSAVVDHALIEALNSNQLAGAVLDVFRKEPLPPSHQFWVTPHLTLTPHIAGPTDGAAMIEFFLSNLNKFQAGQGLDGLVDLERGY